MVEQFCQIRYSLAEQFRQIKHSLVEQFCQINVAWRNPMRKFLSGLEKVIYQMKKLGFRL